MSFDDDGGTLLEYFFYSLNDQGYIGDLFIYLYIYE